MGEEETGRDVRGRDGTGRDETEGEGIVCALLTSSSAMSESPCEA